MVEGAIEEASWERSLSAKDFLGRRSEGRDHSFDLGQRGESSVGTLIGV